MVSNIAPALGLGQVSTPFQGWAFRYPKETDPGAEMGKSTSADHAVGRPKPGMPVGYAESANTSCDNFGKPWFWHSKVKCRLCWHAQPCKLPFAFGLVDKSAAGSTFAAGIYLARTRAPTKPYN